MDVHIPTPTHNIWLRNSSQQHILRILQVPVLQICQGEKANQEGAHEDKGHRVLELSVARE